MFALLSQSHVYFQFCTDTDIGSAGIRALCAAIMVHQTDPLPMPPTPFHYSSSFLQQARGSTMKGEPYKDIKSMRFWRANAGDAGVAAVVRPVPELLRAGGFPYF